ncbi:MAG: DGQHR domain-containing protein [Promethearchaeati archaeon]
MANKHNIAIKESLIETVGLKIKQSSVDRYLYVFSIDGKTIAEQVGVRRMKWHGAKFAAEGFQRPLDNVRVKEIAKYLSMNPILPNALVIAFEKGSLEFQALPNQMVKDAEFGLVRLHAKLQEIDGQLGPLPTEQRIGYVIDGQHRLKSIEESTLEKGAFHIVVSAFNDVDTKFQLEQFYALNQTVPISSGQLALLRRQIGYRLPPKEAYRKAISDICGILQELPGSPFQPETQVGSPPVYKGPLNITVVEKMIQQAVTLTSLRFKWKTDPEDIPRANLEYVAKALYVYWKAISDVFSTSWGKNPAKQRLFCALGMYAMMNFFDVVMKDIDINLATAVTEAKKKLAPIGDIPWDRMLALPSTPKTNFRVGHLVDAINDLWQAEGHRPYTLKIEEPVSKVVLVDIELPGA